MTPIFPELPTKLGIYSLSQMLDSRERSELYLAKQSYVDRAVVIEVLRPDGTRELEEFFRDVVRRRAAASLPHVVPVLESAQTGHLHYLIQELPQGLPLGAYLQEGHFLTLEQGFTFVQAVANMYCACLEQKLAANPLNFNSVYIDGDSFSFLSPVISGESTDDHRKVQMESLANMMESALQPELLENSNLSIIIHWLRNGYGNMPLEWGPLASSLSTLRAQRFNGNKGNADWADLLNPTRLKRRGKRTLRALRDNLVQVVVIAALLPISAIGAGAWHYFSQAAKEGLPAVTERYVYLGPAEQACRVRTAPVSIEEYGEFLNTWERMTDTQKKDLCEGMPPEVKSLAPLQWNEQTQAATRGMEWQGRRVTKSSPVCGVSYWGALACARHMGGELPAVAALKAVRARAGEPKIEEWTAAGAQNDFPLDAGYTVLPAAGGEPMHETDATRREARRGFRVAYKDINNTDDE